MSKEEIPFSGTLNNETRAFDNLNYIVRLLKKPKIGTIFSLGMLYLSNVLLSHYPL